MMAAEWQLLIFEGARAQGNTERRERFG